MLVFIEMPYIELIFIVRAFIYCIVNQMFFSFN